MAPSHWIARAEAPGSDLLPPNSLAEPDALAGSRRMYLSTTNRLAEACAESEQSEQDPEQDPRELYLTDWASKLSCNPV